MNVLAIDIGGTSVKVLATGQEQPRQFPSGASLRPQQMVEGVKRISADWAYDVVSIGYPGPVWGGRIVHEPWNLGPGWIGLDLQAAFGKPVRLVNDAAMQALGAYRGEKMLFLGLGTGLGSCMVVNGIVEPMELGHLPYKDATFEDYVGVCGLERRGIDQWRENVKDVVKRLVAAIEPDEVVLGGGNVHKLKELPSGCRLGDNADAFVGAFRLWEQPTRLQSEPPARSGTIPRSWLLAVLVPLLIWAATVIGQEWRDAGTHGPVDIRPFQLVLPNDHLFGDWGGLRTQLESAAITPTLTLVTDFAWNPSGGRAQGSTEASNLGLDLLFDLDRLSGLKGGSVLVQMSERFGSSLSSKYIGNVFTTQQVFGGETFRLVDVAYQQKLLDDRVEFRIGRLAAGDDFLVSPYDYLFMQNGFNGNPVGIFFNSPGMTAYPNATWGVMVKVKPTPRTYVMGGAYNGDPTIRENRHHGADLSMRGPLFAIAEVGYQVNGLPGDQSRLLGNYKVGAWYDDAHFTDFKSHATPRGSWGFYGLFDQVLVPFGDPASNRGFGVFGSVMYAPDPGVSQMPYFFTAGVAARGLFDARPGDACGLGVVYGHFSSGLQDAQRQAQQLDPSVAVQDYEMAIELTYRFYFRKRALFIQPDIQYIVHPGGTTRHDDALVVGCQIGVSF
jgi:polyphosphate glucokinase